MELESLKVRYTPNGVPIIECHGAIRSYRFEDQTKLLTALTEAFSASVVVALDWSGMHYIDVGSFAMLVRELRKAQQVQKKSTIVILKGLHEKTEKVLRLSGLEIIFEIVAEASLDRLVHQD
jgi:anti-anti-sigma factor